jgi:PRTRC genetic system protein A
VDVDPKDQIILTHAPLVAMPRFTNFPPLEQTGHRFIASEDGLYLEIERPWLHLTQQIAESAMPLPYGPVIEEGHTFMFEVEDVTRLLAQFIVDARVALPSECAAWGVWNDRTQLLEYRRCVTIAADDDGVDFHRPRLPDHEHFAIDIHSHGATAAFFSPTDDEDDRGAVKLAIVLGNLDADAPSMKMRLCALGLFIEFDEIAA